MPARPTPKPKPSNTPPARVTGPNPGAAPMATAQTTTRPSVPPKASQSSPTTPRPADPRGNARPNNRFEGSGGSTPVTSGGYVSGSEKTKAAIGRGASAIGEKVANAIRFGAQNPGAVIGANLGPTGAVVGYGLGKVDWSKQTSNPNAPIPSKQQQRANQAKADTSREQVAAQNRPQTDAYPSVPGRAPVPGRPAPGVNTQAFRGGVSGSGITTPLTRPAQSTQAFRGGVGGSGTAKAPTPPPQRQTPQSPTSGGPAQQQAPKQQPQQQTQPGKGGKGGKGAGATTPQSAQAPQTTTGTQAPSATPTTTPSQPSKPQSQQPFGDNVVTRQIAGMSVDMPARVNLEGVNIAPVTRGVNQKIQEAGGLKNVKEGTVLGSFRGAAGVPWDVTVKNGRLTVVRAGSTQQGSTQQPGAGTSTTPQTSASTGETPTSETPAAPGQSASEYVTSQLLNNPELGMTATNNDATAALVALASKTGLAIAGPNGAIVDPNTLLGGDPNKPFDPETLKNYKLVLAHGPNAGQEVTGQNYLNMQVNPDVGGTDTSLIGTELGNLILKQKQERANLLEQQSQGGSQGGAIGAQQAQQATDRALNYLDLVRGKIGGGLVDIQKTRQEGFQKALAKMLENPEAYGYRGPVPTSSTQQTPSTSSTPKTTPGTKTFKIGDVKTWGGKQHRWNGQKWVTITKKPAKTSGKR